MTLICNLCHILIAQLTAAFIMSSFCFGRTKFSSGSPAACWSWTVSGVQGPPDSAGNFHKPDRQLVPHFGDSHWSPSLVSVVLFTGTGVEQPLDLVAREQPLWNKHRGVGRWRGSRVEAPLGVWTIRVSHILLLYCHWLIDSLRVALGSSFSPLILQWKALGFK